MYGKSVTRTFSGAFFGHPYHSNSNKIHLDAALYYKQPSPKQQSDISQSLFTLWVVLQQLYTYIRKIKRPKFFSHNLDILQNHPYFGISVLFCQFPFLLNIIRPLNHSKISLSLTVHQNDVSMINKIPHMFST